MIEEAGTAVRISVVLPVYHGVDAEHFERSIRSLEEQHERADEVIVVADGPLTPELDAVLERKADFVDTLIRLEENRGVAHACQAGLLASRYEWMARQDADDIALPARFALSRAALREHSVGVLGGAMLEFEGEETNIVRTRRLPAGDEAIRSYVKSNNPINNPTSIVSREATLAVGGVQHLHLLEDYDLTARLIGAGYGAINLDEPLVLFRTSDGMFSRRADKGLRRSEWQLQKNLRRYGLISWPRAIVNYTGRTVLRMLPAPVFKAVYAVLFGGKDSQ